MTQRKQVARQTNPPVTPPGYAKLLAEIKTRIRTAQVKAALAINRELIELYWYIGQRIVERQKVAGWGKSVINRLAEDLQREFPGVAGFSPRNLWRMRAFCIAYTDQSAFLPPAVAERLAQPVRDLASPILPQPVAEIPWGHNIVLLEKLKDSRQRLWYAQKTLEHGWSRSVLIHQIESNLYHRQGKAVTNFERTLPAPQSDLARELLKDPYHFDFLTLDEAARERELEQALLDHLRRFLLELGVGFALVGSQFHLVVANEDYYLDLLFYHLRLRCFVVIDLKMEAFQPEHAGKMNFYLSAVDDLLRHPSDQPSIGLILCKDKNRVIVEYALRDTSKPMGVASYIVRQALPKGYQGSLPSTEQLQAALDQVGAAILPKAPKRRKKGLVR